MNIMCMYMNIILKSNKMPLIMSLHTFNVRVTNREGKRLVYA